MDVKRKNQTKFYDYIEQSIVKNKKISHAYLIDVAKIPTYMNYIKDIVKEFLFMKYEDHLEEKKKISKQVDEESYPDFKIIQPEGSWIKKEQLLNLEAEFSKKSMLNNKLIYVIDKAENLNDSSANTILKFLEEPQDDIIAILLTNNRYQVLDTIVSRCQVLSLVKEESKEPLDSSLIEFIEDIYNQKKLILKFDSYMNDLFSTKENAKKNLELLESYFCSCLDQEYTDYDHINLLKNLESENILHYIELFSEFLERLQYNVNLKLWLTDLLIQVMEVR